MSFFGKDKTLFKLFGLPIKANLSWLLLVALIMVSLAEAWFPRELGEDVTWQVHWGLAFIGTVGLFASLIAHELCHSLVARKTGMPVSGITLFVFGGVSQLEDEPPTAGSEFIMAVVGPLSSVVIGTIFLVAFFVIRSSAASQQTIWATAGQALVKYLAIINFVLAAFNSLPAFPLDGGRVLRSIVWGLTDSLRLATRVAVSIGSMLGFGLMLLGILFFIWQPTIAGLWLVVIGFFLRHAAMQNLRLVTMREYLEGETVDRFMTTDVVTVERDAEVDAFVNDLVFHHRFTYYPVVDETGKLVGIVSARAPRELDQSEWSRATVEQIMDPVEEQKTLPPDADAVDALSLLRKLDEGRVVVVEDGEPVGILSLRDLMGFLALKIDLEPSSSRLPG
ncbi:MAG: CBS domain-containing protein [Planctomycetota bacterium]